MPDDKRKTGPADDSKVNVSQQYELDYWSKKFGVTPERLKDAVKKVGPAVDKVKKELGK
jgi:hypothetical protein